MTKSSGGQRPRPESANGDGVQYEPPRIEVLGTVEELTMGVINPTPDNTTFLGSQFTSDSRLKQLVDPVDPQGALRTVSAL